MSGIFLQQFVIFYHYVGDILYKTLVNCGIVAGDIIEVIFAYILSTISRRSVNGSESLITQGRSKEMDRGVD